MACFRVVQEALHNAVKYAQARQLVVELSQQGTELLLAVRDNGIGFDVSAARRRATRGETLGLLGMEERVLLLGGRFGIQSAPGATEVWARFPLGTGPTADPIREEAR